MAVIETLTFANNDTALDLLLFLRLRQQVAGLVEDTYARNPGLADLGLFPPLGTKILVAIPPPPGASPPAPVIRLY